MKLKSKIYPWQTKIWQLVNQDDKRRAHALLLHGRVGIGKYDFSLELSQAILCAHKDNLGHACGMCSSCNWFNEESHPDFRLLSPEQESNVDEEGVNDKKTKKKLISYQKY